MPEAVDEESLDDVLAAFKERVQEELGDDDPRMRYDLAIGYKEMGMLDEAVAEFEIAATNDALRFESSVMIAVIRREQGKEERVIRVDLTKVMKKGDLGENIGLLPGDIVIVP